MLDAYFKSYFSSFIMASVFSGAFLSSKITNVFVERALQPPVGEVFQNRQPVRRVDTKEGAPGVPADAFVQRNPFGAERENLAESDAEAAAAAATAAAAAAAAAKIDDGACEPSRCSASSVSANLLATFWAGGGASRAVFQSTSGGEVQVVQEGQQLFDQATVTGIYRNNVCVSRNGTCEMFSLDQANKKVATPAVAPKRAPDPAPQLGQGVRKLGEKQYEIEKGEIDSVLSNLNQIARQARIVPSFKNGKSNGFKLFSIRPNSLYAKIGIQNGDIIQKINGYEINSPDKALEIYSKLKDADAITVDLVRRGAPQTMNYSIR